MRSTLVVGCLVSVLLGGCGLGDSDIAASTAVLDLTTTSTQDWGCGRGFTLGTDDQTVRLSLWAETEAQEPGTVEVDGTTWSGELVTGEDLFAQWCDDVVEADEPEVVESARWPVTGTLTWTTEGTGDCDGPATATLSDGRVDTGDEVVPLPDLELRNESFGCFAG